MDEENTKNSFKRLNGETKFAYDIAKDFKGKIDKLKNEHLDSKVKAGKSEIKKGAYTIPFDCKMEDLFKSKNFFSNFLKPTAEYLDSYFIELTDLFFKEEWCKNVDTILNKISKGMIPYKDYKFLQNLPELKEDYEIITSLKDKGFSDESTEELLNLVKNRYILELLLSLDVEINRLTNEKSFSNDLKEEYRNLLETKISDYFSNSWRKGFAYTLTFKEINSKTELKITPGAYLGPAGVVEAEGVVLERPENYNLPEEELVRKSNELHCEFAEKLPNAIQIKENKK